MTREKALTKAQIENIKKTVKVASMVLAALPQTRPSIKVLTLLAVGINYLLQEDIHQESEPETIIIRKEVGNNDY